MPGVFDLAGLKMIKRGSQNDIVWTQPVKVLGIELRLTKRIFLHSVND